MKYKFVAASHIDDYLEAIKDVPEFVVVKKDGYTVINYAVSTDTTFPDPLTATGSKDYINYILRRDCRGIIFDSKTGRVIAKRYHKFFNAGERQETLIKNIDVSKPHVVLEKLDGSMITPFPVEGGIRWGTKMGVTDISLPVEEFVMDHTNYIRFAKECIERDYTPIFEWCSPKQRIVIDHKDDQLILTAIRCNHTGVYYAYEPLVKWASVYNIPVVKVFDSSVDDLQSFIDELSKREDIEGVVIRFLDGHMVKIKTEWYVRIHKAKDLITREHDVCRQVLLNQIDDAKAFLPEEDQRRIAQYEHDLMNAIHSKVAHLTEYVNHLHKLDLSRKDYALKHAINNHSVVNAIVYKAWEDSSAIFNLVVDVIVRNTNKAKNFEEIKGILLENVSY